MLSTTRREMHRENNLSRRTTKASASIRRKKAPYFTEPKLRGEKKGEAEIVVAISVALPPLFRRPPSLLSLAAVCHFRNDVDPTIVERPVVRHVTDDFINDVDEHLSHASDEEL
ncbi:hypothetical protein E6C27_scaffold74G001720 [Cucumis melo var. makuwa]|uniref:CACTA en-spm transposon protein n=1 Tax=Cucumis melo var. makuwa TaxID=1194695 RepID=A0A5A7TUF8_CUCMM|nr:hypothetical protein E6C27_scaffold74G001720 [Cucumis melo var. makuwa]